MRGFNKCAMGKEGQLEMPACFSNRQAECGLAIRRPVIQYPLAHLFWIPLLKRGMQMAGGLQRIKHHFRPTTGHILLLFITLWQADHALIVPAATRASFAAPPPAASGR